MDNSNSVADYRKDFAKTPSALSDKFMLLYGLKANDY
jgi:hypothetical protein